MLRKYGNSRSCMKSRRRSLVAKLALVLFFLTSILNASIADADSPNLITPLPGTGLSVMSTEQKQHVDLIKKRPTTASVSLIKIDINALQGERMRMALSLDKTLNLSDGKIERKSEKDFTWVGSLSEVPGRAVMVVHGENLTGVIWEGRDLYQIEPIEKGVHALIKVDRSRHPPDHPPSVNQEEPVSDIRPIQKPTFDIQQQGGPIEIDVLVGFTPAALQAYPNLPTLIEGAVLLANVSYQDSGINIRLVRTDSFTVSYSESGKPFSTVLQDFARMDDIYKRRQETGSDIAVLIVNHSGACGEAYATPANATNAYAIVHVGCLIPWFTMAHEIGHLQGAQHNPEANPPDASQAYAHGFLNTTAGLATTMAYSENRACPNGYCPRVPCWSTPLRRFPCVDSPANGAVLGTADTHDNVRVLNESASTVAGFLGPPFDPIQDWSRGDSKVFGNSLTPFGDVTGDGKIDAILSSDDSVWVRPSNGSDFLPHQLWLSNQDFRGSFYVHDVTGDGKDDLIVVSVGVTVYPSDGAKFGTGTEWAKRPPSGEGVQFADVTGDRKADMISYSKQRVTVYASTGSGFLPGRDQGYSFNDLDMPHFADVTGEGKAKMIVDDRNGVFVYSLDGAPQPPQKWTTQFSGGLQIYFADVTGDRRADLIFRGSDDALYVGRSNGLNFLPLRDWTNGPFRGSRWTYVGDVTGDGKADAIALNENTITVRPSPPTPPKLPPVQVVMVTVPKVTGNSLDGAIAELGREGLRLGKMINPRQEDPPFIVIGQNPTAGKKVPRGTNVDLTVRAGRIN